VASYLVSTKVDVYERDQSSQIPTQDRGENAPNYAGDIYSTSGSDIMPTPTQETSSREPGHSLPEQMKVAQSLGNAIPTQSEAEILNMVESAIQKTGIEDEQEAGRVYHRKRQGIRARTARRWLHKLGFSWEEVRKGVYVDGHERPDVIQDRAQFLNQLENLQPYLVEFDNEGNIKAKTYPRSCIVGGHDSPIILITHDESTLSSNEGRSRVWKEPNTNILRPKGRGRGIMISDFLLPCGRLAATALSAEERTTLGIPEYASQLFEFGQQNGSGY